MIADLSIAGFALVLATMVTLLYFVVLAKAGISKQIVYLVGKTVQFTLPVVWFLATRPEHLQLAWPDGGGLLLGLAFGGLVAGLMWAGYRLWLKPAGLFAGRVQDEVVGKLTAFGFGSLGPYLALSVFYCLAHSLLEEYYWRWFLFGLLDEHLPLTTAIVISSIGFMAHHVILLAAYFGWKAPVTYIFSLGVGIGGAFWAWLLADSGSIAGPWLSHLLIDAAIFAIGYDLLRDSLTKQQPASVEA